MKLEFPAETFIDVNGGAIDSLNWLYEDVNGKALTAAQVPIKYWTPDAGSVREMNAAEKAAVDAAEALALENAILAELDVEPETDVLANKLGPMIRALLQVHRRRDNYNTSRIEELQQDMQAIKASTGGTANIRAAIRASYLPTTTENLRAAIDQYKLDLVSHKNPEP
jgi:hypothetical protein